VTPDGVVYLGTVNGGVWSYNPADDSGNTMSSWVQAFQDHHPFVPANFWVPLTDSQPSLAVSTMALDPNDPNNTLWVGTGSLSSYGGGGGLAVGILKTTDGGNNWVDLAGSAGATITGASYASPIVITTSNTSNLINDSSVTIRGVGGNTAANGNWTVTNVTATGFSLVGSVGDGTFTTSPNANPVWTSSINGDTILSLVPTKTTDPVTGEQVVLVGTYGQGIFRSTDGRANFASVNFYLNTGVSLASFNANNAFTSVNGDVVTSLVPDPTNPDYFYAAVSGIGIFESYNDGADWFEIDNSISQITNNTYYQLAASPNPDGNTNLYVATAAIATTTTWGATYTGLLMAQISPIPLAPISWIPVSEVLSITHLVGSAVGSPGHFYLTVSPNNPFQVYIGGPVQLLAEGSVLPFTPSVGLVYWADLSGDNDKPHDDQRSIAFLSDGTILAANDGGIYGLLANGNHWADLNVNLQDTEFLSVAYDSQDGAIFGGSQDNGTPIGTGNGPWSLLGGS
jgi:hypothetical protein